MTDEEIKTLWVEVWRKRGLIVEPDEEEIEALRGLLAVVINDIDTSLSRWDNFSPLCPQQMVAMTTSEWLKIKQRYLFKL